MRTLYTARYEECVGVTVFESTEKDGSCKRYPVYEEPSTERYKAGVYLRTFSDYHEARNYARIFALFIGKGRVKDSEEHRIICNIEQREDYRF